eukprot:3993219-Pyramimonas_sp.AAC.1
MDALLTIGGKHFSRAPECRPGCRTLAATIQPLLDRQRELRRQLGAFRHCGQYTEARGPHYEAPGLVEACGYTGAAGLTCENDESPR